MLFILADFRREDVPERGYGLNPIFFVTQIFVVAILVVQDEQVLIRIIRQVQLIVAVICRKRKFAIKGNFRRGAVSKKREKKLKNLGSFIFLQKYGEKIFMFCDTT